MRSLHSFRLPRAVPQVEAYSVEAWLAYRALDADSTSETSVALRWLYNDMLAGFAAGDRATDYQKARCIVSQVQSLLIHPAGGNHANIPTGVGNATLLPDAAGANAPEGGRLGGTERASLASPNGPFGLSRGGNSPEAIAAQWAAEGGIMAAYFGEVVGGEFDFSGRLVRLAPGQYRTRDYASLRSVLCTPQHQVVLAILRAAGHLVTLGAVDNHDPLSYWSPEHNKWLYLCATFCEALRHPMLSAPLSNAELMHLGVGGGWGPVYSERHPVQTWQNGGAWIVEQVPPAAPADANTYRWAHPAGPTFAGQSLDEPNGPYYRMIDSRGFRESYLYSNPSFPAWPEPAVFPHLGLGIGGERIAADGSTSFRVSPPVRHPDAVLEIYTDGAGPAEWQPFTGTGIVAPGLSAAVRALHPTSGDLLAMDTFTA